MHQMQVQLLQSTQTRMPKTGTINQAIKGNNFAAVYDNKVKEKNRIPEKQSDKKTDELKRNIKDTEKRKTAPFKKIKDKTQRENLSRKNTKKSLTGNEKNKDKDKSSLKRTSQEIIEKKNVKTNSLVLKNGNFQNGKKEISNDSFVSSKSKKKTVLKKQPNKKTDKNTGKKNFHFSLISDMHLVPSEKIKMSKKAEKKEDKINSKGKKVSKFSRAEGKRDTGNGSILRVLDLRKNNGKKSVKHHGGKEKPGLAGITAQHQGDNSGNVSDDTLKIPVVHSSVQNESYFPDSGKTLSTPNASMILLKELQEKMNDSIVKESGVILKDNKSGEIKLILKPESLGKVRIRLHLHDNHLSGKIFVDTPEAKDAFVRNMVNLEKAFTDKGFTMGSLNVSVGDKGKGKSRERDDGFVVTRKIIDTIENSIPVIHKNLYADNIIDLVV